MRGVHQETLTVGSLATNAIRRLGPLHTCYKVRDACGVRSPGTSISDRTSRVARACHSWCRTVPAFGLRSSLRWHRHLSRRLPFPLHYDAPARCRRQRPHRPHPLPRATGSTDPRPAALVITVTTLSGLLPLTQHAQLLAEARASLLYFQNFELIRSQPSYEAAGAETSPFQHFWSLSVQGQFYLIWPVVALLAVWLARRTRFSPTVTMAAFIGLLMVAAFIGLLMVQRQDQAEAYLLTQTRIWELGVGGLPALLGTRLVLPTCLRTCAGWLGLVLVISCGFILDGAEPFPGPWALRPLGGMALILASTSAGRCRRASRAIQHRRSPPGQKPSSPGSAISRMDSSCGTGRC